MILKSSNETMNKYKILTDLGNTYYVINRLVDIDNDLDIEYLKDRGFNIIEDKKKKGGK